MNELTLKLGLYYDYQPQAVFMDAYVIRLYTPILKLLGISKDDLWFYVVTNEQLL